MMWIIDLEHKVASALNSIGIDAKDYDALILTIVSFAAGYAWYRMWLFKKTCKVDSLCSDLNKVTRNSESVSQKIARLETIIIDIKRSSDWSGERSMDELAKIEDALRAIEDNVSRMQGILLGGTTDRRRSIIG